MLLFNQQTGFAFSHFAHIGAEAVAALGHSLDDLVALRVAAEGFSEQENILRQAAFFDEAFRPETRDHLLFGDGAATILDEQEQGLEDLRRQRHDLVIAHQDALCGIDAERREIIKLLCVLRHSGCENFIRTF